MSPPDQLVYSVGHWASRRGSSFDRFTTNAAPRRFQRRGAAPTEGSVAGVVRQQFGIEVNLALRDRPTLLVVRDVALRVGVWIVRPQTRRPVAPAQRVQGFL